MKRVIRLWGIGTVSLMLAAGCGTRVRSYVVEKERVDQDLSAGNAGYLAGAPDQAALSRERKLTRQTYVTEVELPAAREKKRARLVEEVSHEDEQQLIREQEAEPVAQTAPATRKSNVTTYTVRNNDTLAKISLAVYGTSKKWKQIYEANTDRLKSPDRIYAGQVLKIPQE